MIISGVIEEIRFRNDENGYSIIVVDCSGEPIVAVGSFVPIIEGESVTLEGSFVVHPRFGKQFSADKLTKSAPNNLEAMKRYLASGLIRGVGEKTAATIVDTFGKESLIIIEYNPLALTKIRGISKNKAIEIGKCFRENKGIQDALMFLQERNISLNLALKIYKTYGDKTVSLVASNPYRLIEDVDGVGFLTADRIAAEMGISKESAFRTRAVVLFILKESSEKYGNTYLPIEDLIGEVSKLCAVSKENILQRIDELVIDRKLKYCKIADDDGVMIKRGYSAELGIAVKLIRLKENIAEDTYDCKQEIDEFERASKLKFHENQRFAIECAVNNGVSIITGGPGTGKTTILKCLLGIFSKRGKRALLMAPTGRAAKRLSESTGFDASTIHRALMRNVSFEGTSRFSINADVVIIDEFSMVDIYLFNNILTAMSAGTRFVIVGDKDQLPSVGPGNCLKDLLDSGQFPSVNLTRIFRQSSNSLISINAHAINNGSMPTLSTSSDSDFFFLRCKEHTVIAAKIVELYSERIPRFLGIESTKIQILCSVKNGIVGANSLNKTLQDIINPINRNDSRNKVFVEEDGFSQNSEKTSFRLGDKVMHIANNYELEWVRNTNFMTEKGEGVFNGDIGVVTKICNQNGSIEVELEDGRQVVYTSDIINQLTLAYAITIHKSQGSEFDAVIVPVTLGSPIIMTRNLLYTAITRAKKMVVLVGEEYSIQRMVDNSYVAKRYSGLRQFLSDIKNDMGILFDDSQ